jgi:hypothetical protein
LYLKIHCSQTRLIFPFSSYHTYYYSSKLFKFLFSTLFNDAQTNLYYAFLAGLHFRFEHNWVCKWLYPISSLQQSGINQFSSSWLNQLFRNLVSNMTMLVLQFIFLRNARNFVCILYVALLMKCHFIAHFPMRWRVEDLCSLSQFKTVSWLHEYYCLIHGKLFGCHLSTIYFTRIAS